MWRVADAVLVTTMAVATWAAPTPAPTPAPTAAPTAEAAAFANTDPADLAVTLSGVPDVTGPESTITYRISVTNGGPGPAPSATLSVEIPNGTTFTSFTAPADWTGETPAAGGTGKVTATRLSLAPGGQATFTLVLTADPGLADATTIPLSAAAGSTASDPNPQNDTATATTQVRNAADLAVTVTADRDPVGAGMDLHYTITLANAGPAAATRVTLTMTTPAGAAFASFTAPSGWASTMPPVAGAGIVTSTAESLPVGSGPVTFDLVVTVLANTGHGARLDLTPAVTSATPDPADGNNTATARTSVANAADLSVSSSDDQDPVDPTATYTITLTNNGPAVAASPTLSIAIVAGTAFSSCTAPNGWAVSAPAVGATGTLTVTAANLVPARPATFVLVLTVTSARDISLTATASSPTTDPVPDNNSATEATAVAKAPRTPASSATTRRDGLPLTGTSLVRLAGATAVVVGLGLLSVARGRARRARRGYR